MSALANLALFDQEHTTLDFKREQYSTNAHPELLKDVIAMANADAIGERYIVIGIVPDHAGRKNRVVGIDPAMLLDDATYQQLIGENVEPALPVRYEALSLEGQTVAVFRIGPCENQPYLLKKDNRSHRRGTGWVRRGSSTKILDRSDYDRIYTARLARTTPSGVRVLFDATPRAAELKVVVSDLSGLPSDVEAGRIRAILEHRDLLRKLGGVAGSLLEAVGPVDRPFASVFGSSVSRPYAERSSDELRAMIAKARDHFADEDRHYLLETSAHRVMLVVENNGTIALIGAALEVTIECPIGVAIPSEIVDDPRDSYLTNLAYMPRLRRGYPSVTVSGTEVRIRSTVDSVLPGDVVNAFGFPLRISTGEQAHGMVIPFRTRLLAQNLQRPIESILSVHVT